MRFLSRLLISFLALAILFSPFPFSGTAEAVLGEEKPAETMVPNQIIVKYRQGQSPEELEQFALERQAKSQSFFGILIVLFEDLKLRLSGQEQPDIKISRLQSADKKAGVIEREKIFTGSDDPSLKNFYLLTTDGSLSVEEMVDLYQQLPEVEYAEPNYIYSTMGIE